MTTPPLIIRNIPRADPETIRVLGELGVATVHEALGRIGLLEPAIRPILSAGASGRQRGDGAVPARRQPR